MTHPFDDLLTPGEVAEMFSVRTETLARWAREGRIQSQRTPGGHRRYAREEIARFLGRTPAAPAVASDVVDAVRMYEQGWSIDRVAKAFGRSYDSMRRLLKQHTTLRPVGRPSPALPPQNGRTDP